MPAVNFMKQFAEDVRTGRKLQTIRDGQRFKVGDRFAGFTGMRTKACEKLVESVVTQADEIRVDGVLHTCHVLGAQLTRDQVESLARADGFPHATAFFAFFARRGPLRGQLIRWAPRPLSNPKTETPTL